jgi:hypothetical protein
MLMSYKYYLIIKLLYDDLKKLENITGLRLSPILTLRGF